tara:strand:+ start:35919 stop:36095 length:177 start_codon:yes stop_codon:yes gene_type:complete
MYYQHNKTTENTGVEADNSNFQPTEIIKKSSALSGEWLVKGINNRTEHPPKHQEDNKK